MFGCSSPKPINYEEMLNERGSIYYTKDTNEPYSGQVFSLHDDGKIKTQGTLKDGAMINYKYFEWYINGQRKLEKAYNAGTQNWSENHWNENGQKILEQTFKNGVENGLRISWNENGDKVYEKKIVDGIISELVSIDIEVMYKNPDLDSTEITEFIINISENLRRRKLIYDAVAHLNHLVKNFSDDSLAPKAQYMLGDIYMNDFGDFTKAIQEYRKVLDNYANYKHRPSALFMIGYNYAHNLNDLNNAKNVYQSFIQQFPNHELFDSVLLELKYLGKYPDWYKKAIRTY